MDVIVGVATTGTVPDSSPNTKVVGLRVNSSVCCEGIVHWKPHT